MHNLLKTLVIGMGVLIFAGLGMLIYGFVKISEDPNWRLFGKKEAAAPASAHKTAIAMPAITAGPVAPSAPMSLSGDVELDLPTGCEVTGVNGAGGLIFVMTGPRGDNCGNVLVIDPKSGRITGRLNP